MAVRRLHPDQPPQFAFTAENLAWAHATIAKYPPGKEASAVIPLMWRAQEQSGGWLPEPAIRAVCDLLDMAYIRGIEIATFYTMFQLCAGRQQGPCASVRHDAVHVARFARPRRCLQTAHRRASARAKRRRHALVGRGRVHRRVRQCAGRSDRQRHLRGLDAEAARGRADGFVSGKPPKPGSQIGRNASCPEGRPDDID